jgi:hypothetical protein
MNFTLPGSQRFTLKILQIRSPGSHRFINGLEKTGASNEQHSLIGTNSGIVYARKFSLALHVWRVFGPHIAVYHHSIHEPT